MNRITHFEIQADTPQRAIEFYSKVFGWTFQKWEGGQYEYWMIMTAEKDTQEQGINGGLLPRLAKVPPQECGVNAFVCTIVVDDFDATQKKILAEGGTIAQPKFALIGMAWQGYFLDTEGNTFGLHQADSKAK